MNKQTAAGILFLTLLVAPGALAQTSDQASASASSDAQNIQAYIDLLRTDVRQQKAEMLGEVMQLSAADAAKFWPIYVRLPHANRMKGRRNRSPQSRLRCEPSPRPGPPLGCDPCLFCPGPAECSGLQRQRAARRAGRAFKALLGRRRRSPGGRFRQSKPLQARRKRANRKEPARRW